MELATILIAVLFQTIFQVNSYACIPQADKDGMVQNIITAINTAQSGQPVAQTPVTPETPVLGSQPVAPVVSEACQVATQGYNDNKGLVANQLEAMNEELHGKVYEKEIQEIKERNRPYLERKQAIIDSKKAVMEEACR